MKKRIKKIKGSKIAIIKSTAESRSSVLGWVVLLVPLSTALFLLIFGSKIPFLREQSSKEASAAAETVWRFGQEYVRKGDYQSAYSQFMKALKIKPDLAEAYISIAQIYYQQGEIDKAIDALTKAVSFNPPQKDLAVNNLGLLYARKGDFKTAVEIFQQVLNLGVAVELVEDNLGNVYLNTGDFSQAVEHYRLALNNRPSLQSMYREMLYRVIAEYRNEEEYAEAWKVASAEFQEGLTPEDYAIYDQSSVDKFARSDSRQVELLSKYALALEMKGDLNEAEKNYRQALALNSMSVDLNYHLGSLYLKMHDYRQARIYLQRTLSLNRSHKEASEALKWLDIQGKGTGN